MHIAILAAHCSISGLFDTSFTLLKVGIEIISVDKARQGKYSIQADQDGIKLPSLAVYLTQQFFLQPKAQYYPQAKVHGPLKQTHPDTFSCRIRNTKKQEKTFIQPGQIGGDKGE